MVDLKHIHGIKAGVKSLVAFVIGGGMQHSVVDKLVIISVKHFSHQEEIFLQAVAVAAQSPNKVMIQAICNIQTKPVNVPFFDPEINAFQKILDDFFVSEV